MVGAIVGAGFITLYASIVTAWQFYQLLPLWLAFILLAGVALCASWFALRQGPVLAVIGIIGAYAVPALVSTGSNNTIALLCYLGLITASSVLVEQRVKRPWLWYLPMAGHLFWLTISFIVAPTNALWFSWLALGLSFALLVWWPQLGYRNSSVQLAHTALAQWLPLRKEHALGALLLLLALLVLVLTEAQVHFIGLTVLLILLAAAAYSDSRTDFCLVLLLSNAALTMAIAVQLVLITLLSRKQQLPLPGWLVKLLVSLLLSRLTAAAVLDSYQDITILGLHWSFVLYPVVLLCLVVARKLWQNTALTPWLEGSCLHLLVLFVTVQTQYWLATGSALYLLLEPEQLSLLATAVHACNWLLLATIYLWRSALAGSLQQLYRIAAMLLLAATALLHGYLSLQANPFVTNANLGSGLIWNQLLPLWAVPALLCFLCARVIQPELRKLMLALATGFTVLFITASIRHFWQEGSIGIGLTTSMSEHFSYSLVYLLLAIALVLSAQRLHWHNMRKAGFVLLSLVILKVFLFDLAGLAGILRALSFIGLGFSLVLLSWWFQRSSPALAQGA